MDFTLAPEIEDIRLRVRAFIEKEVLPLEKDPENFADYENIPHARLAMLDCGHLFLVTLPQESARIVDAFLAEPDHDRRAAPTQPPPTRRTP